MASPVELRGTGESRWAGTDDRHLFTGPFFGRPRFDKLSLEGLFNDGKFVFADSNRIIIDPQDAGILAGSRADPAGDFRQVVGRIKQGKSAGPIARHHLFVPFGDVVSERTAPMAEGGAAVHTTAGLLLRLFLFTQDKNRTVILDPL